MKLNPIPVAFIATLFLLQCALSSTAQPDEKSSVHVGFVYPISNHGNRAADATNSFSFHLIAGISKAETGFSMAGLSNIVKEDAAGFQLAGFSNIIGRNSTGFLMSGFLNRYENGQGVNIAGFSNLAKASTGGFTVAGFLNSYESGKGIQVSGFSNLASQDIKGFQIAGFLNKANKVNGVQLAGFMNIADSSDYPIALLNWIEDGTKAIGLSTDEDQIVLTSFRSGGRVLYGILGVGYQVTNKELNYAFEGGLGAHLLAKSSFSLNAEIASTNLVDFDGGTYSKVALRLLPAYKFTKNIELYAGPTFNHVYADTDEGVEMIKYDLWKKTYSEGELGALTIGFIGGLQWYF